MCVAYPLDGPGYLFLNNKIKLEPTNAIKKKQGTYMSWSKKHANVTKHSRYSITEEQWKGFGTMLFPSEMGSLTDTFSQMALMKQYWFLKNFIERILAPSLKEKIIIILFSPAYLQSWNNNRSIAPFGI